MEKLQARSPAETSQNKTFAQIGILPDSKGKMARLAATNRIIQAYLPNLKKSIVRSGKDRFIERHGLLESSVSRSTGA